MKIQEKEAEKVIKVLVHDSTKCPGCFGKEIGYSFLDKLWNCNDCGVKWSFEGLVMIKQEKKQLTELENQLS